MTLKALGRGWRLLQSRRDPLHRVHALTLGLILNNLVRSRAPREVDQFRRNVVPRFPTQREHVTPSCRPPATDHVRTLVTYTIDIGLTRLTDLRRQTTVTRF